MNLNQENGIKLEENAITVSNSSIVKSEQDKASIKNDPIDTEFDESSIKDNYLESDDETFEPLVKEEEIEMNVDNFKFEQFDDLDENSLDYNPSVVKKSKKKNKGSKDVNRVKKKTKPTKIKGPGYCEDCKKEHIENVAEGEKKEYPCNLCEKSYKCIRYLKRHEKFHAETFKCEFCGVSVTTKDVLETHINNRHKGPYPCEICGKLFSSVKAVGRHRGMSHFGKVRPPKKVEILKCTVCEKECKGEKNLREHMICHSTEKPHTCDICGASFSRKSSFYIHKKNHNEEQFACDICGKTLKTSQTLALHKLTHTDISFSCTMCDKSFSSKAGLGKHNKSHTGIGLYHCDLCEKTFITKFQLTRHARTHSGVKPYYCEACNMSFYSNGELIKHKKLSIRHADNMKKMGGSNDEVVDEFKDENAD